MKNISVLLILLVGAALISSCEKQDPFVDRVVSPVLVLIESSDGELTSGLTTDPTVSAGFESNSNIGIKILSLDKTNILDYTMGIDTIPVSSISVNLKIRNGESIGTFTTDAEGLAKVDIDWSQLGVTAAGTSVSMAASGSYNDQSFTKLFKIVSK